MQAEENWWQLVLNESTTSGGTKKPPARFLILIRRSLIVRVERRKKNSASVIAPRNKKNVMTSRIARIAFFSSSAVLLSAFVANSGSRSAAKAQPHSDSSGRHCTHAGGSLITNFGAVDPNTTLGPASGDLRGAVAATLTQPAHAGPNGTVIFNVQHHWVTDSGDNIYFDPAVAITIPVSQTRFAIISYPAHIIGGTGKFAGADGHFDVLGEADLQAGTALRYSGEVCFADADDR